MAQVFPQYLIGTQAFFTYCTQYPTLLSQWIEQGHPRSLFDRGIVVSLATIMQISEHLDAAIAQAAQFNPDAVDDIEDQRAAFDSAVEQFNEESCVLGLASHHETLARSLPLSGTRYMRLNGEMVTVPTLERLVLATAIQGFFRRPIWLIDLDQPAVFGALAQRYGLNIQRLPRPVADRMRRVS